MLEWNPPRGQEIVPKVSRSKNKSKASLKRPDSGQERTEEEIDNLKARIPLRSSGVNIASTSSSARSASALGASALTAQHLPGQGAKHEIGHCLALGAADFLHLIQKPTAVSVSYSTNADIPISPVTGF